MEIILKAENITKTFGNQEEVLKDITLDIKANSFTVLLGHSGSGKSTLLNVLAVF